ncbi:GTP-binding protein Rho1 [Basidiobolus ranarum]|uniref:GTP-binding protein Rho1 n=1 Tax=Basidiobolus ranarum TaxID=34480 RepID=A0ABR2VW20_9FUNG
MTYLRRKLVIVGDGACGKTCLLMVYAKNEFPATYAPTVFENYVARVQVSRKVIDLSLWDTAGQEEYDRLRPLSYPETHVVLLAFGIDNPISLSNIAERWHPEIEHFLKNVPFFLIGCKQDLRQDSSTIASLTRRGMAPVTYQEGETMARQIQARRYLECSAKLGIGVEEVFEAAARAAISLGTKKVMRSCVVL